MSSFPLWARIVTAVILFVGAFGLSIFLSVVMGVAEFSLWLTLLCAIILGIIGFFIKELGWILEILSAFG
ncbi:MAG: hypothetical protein ACFFCZ_15805 [Promethearchaeota archaeon]